MAGRNYRRAEQQLEGPLSLPEDHRRAARQEMECAASTAEKLTRSAPKMKNKRLSSANAKTHLPLLLIGVISLTMFKSISVMSYGVALTLLLGASLGCRQKKSGDAATSGDEIAALRQEVADLRDEVSKLRRGGGRRVAGESTAADMFADATPDTHELYR